jgi:hypothetical protein
MMKKVKARFPNDSYWVNLLLDLNRFEKTSEFNDEIFGVYKNTTIAILKKSLEENVSE